MRPGPRGGIWGDGRGTLGGRQDTAGVRGNWGGREAFAGRDDGGKERCLRAGRSGEGLGGTGLGGQAWARRRTRRGPEELEESLGDPGVGRGGAETHLQHPQLIGVVPLPLEGHDGPGAGPRLLWEPLSYRPASGWLFPAGCAPERRPIREREGRGGRACRAPRLWRPRGMTGVVVPRCRPWRGEGQRAPPVGRCGGGGAGAGGAGRIPG